VVFLTSPLLKLQIKTGHHGVPQNVLRRRTQGCVGCRVSQQTGLAECESHVLLSNLNSLQTQAMKPDEVRAGLRLSEIKNRRIELFGTCGKSGIYISAVYVRSMFNMISNSLITR